MKSFGGTKDFRRDDWLGVFGSSFASSCSVIMTIDPARSWTGEAKPRRSRNIMDIYKAFIVDRNKAKILREVTCIGRDESEAALEIGLTEAEKSLQRKDELQIVWQCVGSFERISKTRVILDEDDD